MDMQLLAIGDPDTSCTQTSDTATNAAFAMTCTWSVTATNSFWATSVVAEASFASTELSATFSELPCGDDSSAIAFAGLSSAVLLF